MNPNKITARLAGGTYLIVVLTGFFTLAYVPSQLIVNDDAIATFNSISANQTLFRLGILAGLICYVAFLILPFLLYKLLESVNKTAAVAMVGLAVVSVPVSLVNLVHKFNVLGLLEESNGPGGNLPDQVMQYIRGILLLTVFWGLWLLPFGYLVYKSGFLPKVLGIFLIAGCFGYLINFTGYFFFPNYADLGVAPIISKPSAIGEIGICLYLLIVGVKGKEADSGRA